MAIRNKMNESEEQSNNSRPWLFQPGVSGNPGGRPKGSKSLKTYAQEMIRDMPDSEKLEFMRGLDKELIWKMSEGNPHSTESSKVEVILPKPILGGITNAVQDNHSTEQDTIAP